MRDPMQETEQKLKKSKKIQERKSRSHHPEWMIGLHEKGYEEEAGYRNEGHSPAGNGDP